MLYLLFLPSLGLACDNPCTKCELEQQLWVEYLLHRNSCDSSICLDSSPLCNNSCSNCSDSGNNQVKCSSITSSTNVCRTFSTGCGTSLYSSESGNISIPYPFPPKSLCYWVIDVRSFVKFGSQQSLEITIVTTSNV